MRSLLIAILLGVVIAANHAFAGTNTVDTAADKGTSVSATNSATAKEFEKVEKEEKAARDEVDHWIRENNDFAGAGAGVPKAELNPRILKRFEPVRKSYEDFIKRHPDYAPARTAYGSFLEDIGDEDEAVDQLEKSRELDPTDAEVWNILANHYGHRSPVKTAFKYYEKAIELNPSEPVYLQNFATTVYLFRKDAREYYGITEQQVFDKALALYTQALKLDPTNFPLATDLAQSYYGIKPVRTEDALRAWTNALKIASDEVEREGVYVHLARFKFNAGRLDEARAQLTAVTNQTYAELKKRLLHNIEEKEKLASDTNQPPAAVSQDPASVSTNAPAKTP
jgi:tetratricopeptide (TPR) repeat protein